MPDGGAGVGAMTRRRVLLLGTAWLLSLLVLDVYMVLRPENLSYHAERALAEMFTAELRVGSVEASLPSSTVTFSDVEMMYPDDPQQSLLKAAAIRVRVSLLDALLGGPPVREVHVTDAEARLAWNEGVLQLPSVVSRSAAAEDDALPKVRLNGLTVHLLNTPFLLKDDVRLSLPDLEIMLVPEYAGAGRGAQVYQFRGDVDDPTVGDLTASGRVGASILDLEFTRDADTIVSDGVKPLLRQDVSGLLDQLQISGDIRMVGVLRSDQGPGELRDDLGVRFTGHMQFHGVDARVHPDGPGEPPWPQSLTGLEGEIRYEDGRFETVGEITGSVEGARLTLQGDADFSQATRRIELNGSLIGLRLTDDLVGRIGELPDPGSVICEHLRQFRIRGPTNIDFKLAQSGDGPLRPEANVHLRGCDFELHGPLESPGGRREGGFPYPIRNLTGTVHLTDQDLQIKSLNGVDGRLVVGVLGTVNYARKNEETYDVIVRASGLDVDETLLRAFDPSTARVLRDLSIQATVGLQVILRRGPDDPLDVDPQVFIDLKGMRLFPSQFPYALEDAWGQVEVTQDDTIKFDFLEVRHGDARIGLSGYVGVGARDGEYRVDVSFRDLVVDQELRDGLSELAPDVADVLEELSIGGKITRGDLTVEKRPSESQARVRGLCYLDGMEVSPTDPPVGIRDLRGALEVWFRPEYRVLRIEEADFSVGAAPLSGSMELRLDGGWLVDVKKTDVVVDDTFIEAMTGVFPEWGALSPELKASGHMDVDVTVKRASDSDDVTVRGGMKLRGLSVTPPGWTATRIEGLVGQVDLNVSPPRLTGLVARIPRPAHLPPLAARSIREDQAPFQATPSILLELDSLTVSQRQDGSFKGLVLNDVRLGNVPLEVWVFALWGLPGEGGVGLELPPVTGIMDLSFTSAHVTSDTTFLTGGGAEITGAHLGADSEFYLEQGALKDVEFTLDRKGVIRFGGPNTELVATNLRMFGIPVPHLEAYVQGDNQGVTLGGVVGTLFGYEQDSFHLDGEDRESLIRRVIARGYENDNRARGMTDAQLEELIQREEEFDTSAADLAGLRQYAVRRGIVRKYRAQRMPALELRSRIEQHRKAERLGIIWGETTELTLTWDGDFSVNADLLDVRPRQALERLGASVNGLEGLLNARVKLEGALDDLSSWTGSGRVSGSAQGLMRLPVFLSVIKFLQLSIRPVTTERLECAFEVKDGVVTLVSGELRTGEVDLELVPPGTITFGGIVSARLDVEHPSLIPLPLISDILGAIPSLLLDAIVVEGPLEDPDVSTRSLGVGGKARGTAAGRRPLMKPLRVSGG